MTVRLAAFALFSVDFRKKFRNVVDFSRRGALPNRENVYNEGKFFVFPRFRSIAVRLPFGLFRRASGARVEKRSNRRATRTSASREGARTGVNVKERRDLRRWKREVKTFRRLEDFPAELRGGVLSVGKFDGLHRGHAEILARLTETARRRNAPSVVFTFDPPPALALRPDAPSPLLCDVEQKIALFERFDLDALILFPTTKAFLSRSATEFIAETVVGVFGATGLVEGEDFRFGRGQEADGAALSALCARFGLTLEIAPSVLLDGDGEPISSSSIRAAVSRGDVSDAARALGRPFRLRGVVETGDRRGRTLGFPTANVAVPTSTVVPAPGLYAAKATLPDGRVFSSAVNVGGNPTFGVSTFKIEAHLLDFCGDLYGQTLTLDFLRRLRDVVPFPSKDALLAQIAADVAETRRVCAATPEDAVR